MKYDGVVAIIDNEPDCHGDVLSGEPTLSTRPVLVRYEYDRDSALGAAWCWLEGKNLVAYMDIDETVFPKNLVENLYAVVRGKILRRNGQKIEKWQISEILLTSCPADKRLKKVSKSVVYEEL